ncbi:hypothetical protein [Thiohalorhabdus methylotrophus]|uniref:MSHA biogenesis protein MshK n=1 Tax=Thiohalorhabdus methylotrophus TaxID=3242694 RepID=A0ABV4U1M1_9GAMM
MARSLRELSIAVGAGLFLPVLMLAGVTQFPPVQAGGGRVADPTRPPEVAAPGGDRGSGGGEAERLVLQTLLQGPSRRLAIISGRSVRVGERIGGYTVQNILQDRVVLSGEGGTRTLRLAPTSSMEKVPSN